MKILIRSLMLYLIIVLSVILCYSELIIPKGQTVEIRNPLFVSCLFLFLISYIFLWIYFFKHWGMSQFHESKTKTYWFWVIIIGGFFYFVGPIAYYIIVYEMKKGVVKNKRINHD